MSCRTQGQDDMMNTLRRAAHNTCHDKLCLRAWNSTSGVPQEDLQVDCPRVSLEKPKSAIFSCDPLCSSRLSSCTGEG